MKQEKIGYWKGMPSRAVTLFGHFVKSFFLRKTIILNVLFLLLVPGIAFVTILSPPEDIERYQWWFTFIEFGNFLYLQIFVLIYCVLYGSSLMRSDIEDRTMTYLITRGAKRYEVLLWKYLGSVVSLSLVFIISEFLTYAIMSLHGPAGSFSDHFPLFIVLAFSTVFGITIYIALFSMIGLISKHPLMVSLGFAFIWDIIIVNIPYNINKISIMHYLRSIFARDWMVMSHLQLERMTDPIISCILIVVLTLVFMTIGSFSLSRKDIH